MPPIIRHIRAEAIIAALKIVVLIPIVVAFIAHLQNYRSPAPIKAITFLPSDTHLIDRISEPSKTPDQFIKILMQTFGATALLGIIALISPPRWQRLHHVTTIIFFGVVAFIIVVNVMSELWSSGLEPSLYISYFLMVLTLSMCIAGIVVETRRHEGNYVAPIA